MDIIELRTALSENYRGTDFIVSDISNAGGYDKNDLLKIVRKGWENGKYEFHYELQKSNPKEILELRIDCHFNPYMPYEKDGHDAEDRQELVAVLREIAELTVGVMPYVRTESRFAYNSLWGAKWALSDDKCVEQIIEIINDTWQDIDGIVKRYN